MKTWRVTLRGGTRRPYVVEDTVEVRARDGQTAVDRAKERCRDCGVQGTLRVLRIVEVGEEAA